MHDVGDPRVWLRQPPIFAILTRVASAWRPAASLMPTPDPRWRAADPNLVTRHWNGEDEWVVYSPRSGDVHLLNEAANTLLGMLAAEALTAGELVERLAAAAGRVPDLEFHHAVDQSLATLDQTGLVEPQRP